MKRLKNCHIAEMLRLQKKHVSFHTPGHKRAGADITELSYSDNLLSPSGVLAQAQKDIAQILGASRSFILTDGSTSGVYSMLQALKAAGCRSVAASVFSHRSVRNGCKLLGLHLIEIPSERENGIPLQPSISALEEALIKADALLLTSPDYYGNFPPLQAARELCNRAGKPLIIDGAHGAHLHFTETYAGRFADVWVDGLHKSLPALTQGACVSAKTEQWGEKLAEAVTLFRTTSPSYPVMASVEYAVKYPRNEKIERVSEKFK
ncbi:MAG: aminotransferase class I/II-fold pyridoxal phosphate-dependent enzyme, partial [Clostridiales bacterium]|nr:aminotransferase class I/II-fold pyridoxal phosphate-dependent enzyme [Clostridiales bacterium]